jgi:hypothetical protein
MAPLGGHGGVHGRRLVVAGDVDDAAELAGPHAGCEGMGQTTPGGEIQRHGFLPFRLRTQARSFHGAGTAGVVDQDIQLAETGLDHGHGPRRHALARDILDDDQGPLVALPRDGVRHRLQQIPAPGEEGKSAAFRRQMFGDGGAETNAGAGHQGDTAGQLQIHVQLPRKNFTGPETIALPAIVKDGV